MTGNIHAGERLARRYRQEGVANAIRAVIDPLKVKMDITVERDLERQWAYDDILAADADLDDAIRTLYNSAEIFERENLGAGIITGLFPEGGFTVITDLSIAQESVAAEALATKVESLGAAHALAPHAVKLQTLAAAVRAALVAQDTAIRATKTAEADEEIAQTALRRQYEVNYLDARKNLGRTLAERIFPVSKSNPAPAPGPQPAPVPA